MDISLSLFDRLQAKSSFVFVRHGESVGNKQKKIQGHTDHPLTEAGRSQADTTGVWLRRKSIVRIFSSPLARAAETAERIGDAIGINRADIVFSDDLKELDTGIFSGKTYAEIEQEHADAWKAFRWRSWEAVPGAERISELVERALRHWNRIIDHAAEGPILSVTHGGFLQWLIKSTYTTHWKAWMPLMHFDNCGVSELTAEPVAEAPPGVTGRAYAEWKYINLNPQSIG